MHRGVKAYTDCRFDAAYIYLQSALEIALLRSFCEKNLAFSSFSIIKPAEFIMQLLLLDENFEDAYELLSQINAAQENPGACWHDQVKHFLMQQELRIELALETAGEAQRKPVTEIRSAYLH